MSDEHATKTKTKASNARHYDVIESDNGTLIKTWTRGVLFEEEARQQLQKMAQLPFVYKWTHFLTFVDKSSETFRLVAKTIEHRFLSRF